MKLRTTRGVFSLGHCWGPKVPRGKPRGRVKNSKELITLDCHIKLIRIQSCIQFYFMFLRLPLCHNVAIEASTAKHTIKDVKNRPNPKLTMPEENSHLAADSFLHIAYNTVTLDEFEKSYLLPLLDHMIGNPR